MSNANGQDVVNAIHTAQTMIYSGNLDPSVTPITAIAGTLYLGDDGLVAGKCWQKQDNGHTANWKLISGSNPGSTEVQRSNTSTSTSTVIGNGVAGDIDLIEVNATGGGIASPSLGTASNFAVLAATAITNTGASVLTGDVGESPGNTLTGFPPGTQTGAQHLGDATAAAAQVALTAAYNDLATRPGGVDISGQDLGGKVLAPGIYKFTSSAQLTGMLTLAAGGNPNAVWIFQIGSTLTTASGSSVVFTGGGLPGNVFWQVGSSATLGTTTALQGNILAQVSITANTGATVAGRLFARTGAVTFAANTSDASVAGNAGGTPLVITLPNPATYLGLEIIVKKVEDTTNPVSIVSAGGALMDGQATDVLNRARQSATFMVNNAKTAWDIVATVNAA